MKKNKKLKLSPFTKKVLRAAKDAAKDAVLEHRRYNVPLIVLQRGKIVSLDPNKVKI